jgi:putative sterol carrier protein
LPESAQDFFDGLPGRFNADKAVGLNAIYQFVITGDDGGAWSATIADGACIVEVGEHAAPSLTITTSSANWRRIVTGDLDPQTAFMTGRLRIKGDMGLAMRLRSLFF